jgi:transcriptional regulator with XRE-family HTH domain
MMTGTSLNANRREAGWTQERLAAGLGCTQEYVSLMERGRRPVPDRVARAVTRLLHLPATALPLPESMAGGSATDAWVERAVTRLGYPGFAYRTVRGRKSNPTEVLLRALARDDLDPRLVEALPWLLLHHTGFDLEPLVVSAKLGDLQNRLGFTVTLALEVARRDSRWRHRLSELRRLEELLEPSRLAREEAFGGAARSDRMRDWLRATRSKAAEHWNLLTDLKTEHLAYAGEDQGTVAELPA